MSNKVPEDDLFLRNNISLALTIMFIVAIGMAVAVYERRDNERKTDRQTTRQGR